MNQGGVTWIAGGYARLDTPIKSQLKLEQPSNPVMRVSHECLYQWIYAVRIDRTWDNGAESAPHRFVDEALGMLTYYAEPYSAWQRGGSKRTGTGISTATCPSTRPEHLTQDEIDDIVSEINDTPMKPLDY